MVTNCPWAEGWQWAETEKEWAGWQERVGCQLVGTKGRAPAWSQCGGQSQPLPTRPHAGLGNRTPRAPLLPPRTLGKEAWSGFG